MLFKYSCIVLLISVAILFAQAKQDKEGESKQNGKSLLYKWPLKKEENIVCSPWPIVG